MFDPDGTPGEKYTIVCDGARAWAYARSVNEYDMMPRAIFERNDLGSLGLFGSLVVGTIGGNTNGRVEADDLIKSGFQAAGGAVPLADGTVCPVFALAAGRGQMIRFALDPKTAMIRQLFLNGRQQGVRIAITEMVAQQSPSSSLPPSLFTFTPPLGTKRDKTLSMPLL